MSLSAIVHRPLLEQLGYFSGDQPREPLVTFSGQFDRAVSDRLLDDP